MPEYKAFQIGLRVKVTAQIKGVRRGAVGVISGRSQFREVLTVVIDGKTLAFLPEELELVVKAQEG